MWSGWVDWIGLHWMAFPQCGLADIFFWKILQCGLAHIFRNVGSEKNYFDPFPNPQMFFFVSTARRDVMQSLRRVVWQNLDNRPM